MTQTNDPSADAAALFDLDGVLVDSESQYTICWDNIEKKFPTGYEDFSTRIKGTTLKDILATYFPPDTHSAIRQMLYDFESNMCYRLLPGVRELLGELKRLHVPAVMVTSSNNEKMSRLWAQQSELRDFFSYIVTADMISRSKPDPEGYLLGARKAGVHPSHCAVFEDSPQGVRAGHEAGAFVIGIPGTVPPERLEPYADMMVTTLQNFDIPFLLHTLSHR